MILLPQKGMTMIPPEIAKWLDTQSKGDLQECTWEEIRQALKIIGRECPIAEIERLKLRLDQRAKNESKKIKNNIS